MGRVEAARELITLLAATDLPYRDRWTVHGTARRGHSLNLAAIGRVVAGHLVNTDRLDDVLEASWPRRHKDWLQRCLTAGQIERTHRLDLDSLRLFCDAFEMLPRHRAQLAALWEADTEALLLPLIDGRRAGPGPPPGWPGRRPPPRGYHSVRVQEEHVLGPEGRPRLHRTAMTLMADVDDLRTVTYMFDTVSVAMEVESGGRTVGPLRQIEAGLWGQDIALDSPLRRGEHREVRYTTFFHHRHAPAPEFRRPGGSNPDTRIDVRVRFDPRCLPRQLVRCLWSSLDGPPLAEGAAALDEDHTSNWTVVRVQPGVLVGYRWAWPDQPAGQGG